MVFADTGYFVALLSSNDAHHSDAVTYADVVASDRTMTLVTTDAVLVELLNFFASRGEEYRSRAIELVGMLMISPATRIEAQTRELLSNAIGLYANRPDKNWSVTDCMSFLVMDQLVIHEALAVDAGFDQAGKQALLRR